MTAGHIVIDFITYDVVAQAVGVLASIVVICSFTQKQDNRLKIVLILGNLIFLCHFFMLGAYAGMFVNGVNALRVGSSIKFHKSTKLMLVFMTIYTAFGFYIYESVIDLLPVLSGILGTFSMFKLSGIKMRLIGLLGSSAWLSYAIIYHSIGGIITEMSAFILNISTILRLRRDNHKDEKRE